MRKNTPFYALSLPEDSDYEPYGIAYFPDNFARQALPNAFTEVTAWNPPVATLRDGDYFDVLANDEGTNLVSDRLHRFLDSHRAPEDPLQWLPVRVVRGNEAREYHILRFARDLHPLHREATSWIGADYPRIPVLRKELVGRHHVLGIHASGYGFVVSAHLRKLLISEFEGCFCYRPIDVA